jgi:restriction endonuclease S subunit
VIQGRKSIESERWKVPRWTVPDGWQWCSLSDVILGGEPEIGDAKATQALINDAGTIPLIQSGDLKNRKEIQTSNKITQSEAKKLNHLIRGKKRVILMAAARETMGRVGILDLAAGQTVAANIVVQTITPNEDIILRDFLFYYFLLRHTRNYIQNDLAPGSTYIPPDITATARVIVPPLVEQQRIVERIEALIQDIERYQRLLEKKSEDTLNSFYYAINETFAPTRVKAWINAIQVDKLLSVTDNNKQKHKADDQAYEQYRDYPYIQARTIEPLTGRLGDLQMSKMQKSILKTFVALDDAQETILLDPDSTNEGITSKIRAVFLQLDQIVYHPKLFHLTIRQQADVQPEFIFWSLLARTPLSDGLRFGDITLTSGRLKKAILPFAQQSEQTAIVNHLNSIHRLICEIQEKQDNQQKQLEYLKQNILEKAFRGLL